MKPVRMLTVLSLIFSFVLIFSLTAFILPAEKSQDPAPANTPQGTAVPDASGKSKHKDIPSTEPWGSVFQTVHDQTNELTADQKQAYGGDDFKNGKYERPFDPSMNYLPAIDLKTVKLNHEDPVWIYVQFIVAKSLSVNPDIDSRFMMELDTNLDSRGDILIIFEKPVSTEWSTDGVIVKTAPDGNVGGIQPVHPDGIRSTGRGYYQEIFNNGKGDDNDLAWSRLSKKNPDRVELAFKNKLTGGFNGKFIWLPWTNIGMLDWSIFEFNDFFTFEEAGNPIKDKWNNYPIKAIWGVDNTCREPSGFVPEGTLPGLCLNYDPMYNLPDQACTPCPVFSTCPPCQK